MRRAFALIALLGLSACDPRCTSELGRTNGGVWACRTGGGIFATRRDGAPPSALSGNTPDFSGGVVWTLSGNELRRYEDDAISGALVESPADAGFSVTGRKLGNLLAHERDVVLSGSNVVVVSAQADRLELTSTVSGSFPVHSFEFAGAAKAFVDLGPIIWMYGPMDGDALFCAYSYNEERGITDQGQCFPAPTQLIGASRGGLWLNDDLGKHIQFFRPAGGTFEPIESTSLPPALWWTGAPGVPWTTHPDPSTLLVPRVAGHVWTGVTEEWVYETPTDGSERTRVYAR